MRAGGQPEAQALRPGLGLWEGGGGAFSHTPCGPEAWVPSAQLSTKFSHGAGGREVWRPQPSSVRREWAP